MCGRFTQTTGELEGFVVIDATGPDPRYTPRYNVAPSQEVWVIRQHPKTGENERGRLIWGFRSPFMVERGIKDCIIARCESVATNGLFKSSYARRRCLVPVDNFFEWKGRTGQKGRPPYAIAMKDRSPFAIAGIWTGYQAAEGEWQHTFAVLTCPANDIVGEIHDRMPVIIAPKDYDRWLSTAEPDPHDLLRPYPSEPMAVWPISPRVNKPDYDVADVLDPID